MNGPKCHQGYLSNTTLTRRLKVSIELTETGVRTFWRSLFAQNETVIPVSVRGKVLVGIGNKVWPHTRVDTSKPRNYDDPYWHPQNPDDENVMLTWLDYSQQETKLWFRKITRDDEIPADDDEKDGRCEE
jgi:hypothetical protein